MAQGSVATQPAQTVVSLHAQLSDICRAGIARACTADEKIGPVATKATADADAAKKASRETAENARSDRDATRADLVARADVIRQSAREVLSFLGADENGCVNHMQGACPSPDANAAGAIIALANQAEACGPRCVRQIDDAETRLKALQKDIAELKQKRALVAATAACDGDIAGCKADCSGDAASDKCVVLAKLIAAGDARVATASDPVKALEMTQKGCAAGNRNACIMGEAIQTTIDKMWNAVQGAGDRLASNRYTLAMVLQLRPTPRNQRDVETARRLEPGTIAQEYCPARAEFIRWTSAAEFQRRAGAHCKDNPPTAQGPTGAQVPLPQECTAVFALTCR